MYSCHLQKNPQKTDSVCQDSVICLFFAKQVHVFIVRTNAFFIFCFTTLDLSTGYTPVLGQHNLG